MAAALLLVAAPAADEAAGVERRPNVVVVMTDDQDVASMRVMGAVNRLLGSEGTTFRNAFATFPLCCPSRATFLTGQYAHNHGVLDNEPPDGGYESFDDSRTLPIALRRAGYRTGYVGKYLNGYRTLEIPPGWSEWHAPMQFANRMFRYRLNENGRPRWYGTDTADYQTDVLGRKAATFITRAARRPAPFFLTLAMGAPHSESGLEPGSVNPRPAPRHRDRFRHARLPQPPSFDEEDVSDKPEFVRSAPRIGPAAYRELTGRYRGRLGSLLAVDDAVQRVVRRLTEAGELRNTLIIFTSDNGYMLGEHRLAAKTRLYEESARVPLIMRGPAVPRGAVREQVVGNIDLAPTIMSVAGAEPLREMDGRSLIPIARDPNEAAGRDILLENKQSAAVRTSRYMYAEHPDPDLGLIEFELYDLATDPYQLESRHNDPTLAAVRAELAVRLQELKACSGITCQ